MFENTNRLKEMAQLAQSPTASEADQAKMHEVYEEGLRSVAEEKEERRNQLSMLLRQKNTYEKQIAAVKKIGEYKDLAEEAVVGEFCKDAIIQAGMNDACTQTFFRAVLANPYNIDVLHRHSSHRGAEYGCLDEGLRDTESLVAVLNRSHLEDMLFSSEKDVTTDDARSFFRLVFTFPDLRLTETSSGNAIIGRFLDKFPEIFLEYAVSDVPEKIRKSFIKTALNRYIYSFGEDDEMVVDKALSIRNKLEEMLPTLNIDDQQELLPLFVYHYADVDFYDEERLQLYLEKIQDPQIRNTVSERIKLFTDVDARREMVYKKWELDIERNNGKILDQLTERNAEDNNDLETVLSKKEEGCFVSINFPVERLVDIIGAGRYLSNWDVHNPHYSQGFTMGGDLKALKHDVESFLGIRGKGSARDPHPVYGAVGDRDGVEEHAGAADSERYGHCHVKVDPGYVAETALFSVGDSLRRVETEEERGRLRGQIVDFKGAVCAKALLQEDDHYREEVRYVEVILMNGLTLDHVTEIVVPKQELEAMGMSEVAIREKIPPHITLRLL